MSLFGTDAPIDNIEQDTLGRGPLAEALADAILQQEDERSLAIGIYGKWGDGKTSLVNLVCARIEQADDAQKPVVIRFRGWGAQSVSQLLGLYGKAIQTATKSRLGLSRTVKKLIAALGEYEDAIAGLVPGAAPFVAAAAATGKRFAASDDPQERVRSILKGLKQRVLVVIDDIDRLSDEEIRFVFRFVNQLADFPNTTYLLPFDYEVVAQALNGVQGMSGEAYLAKVIQVPVHLPPPAEGDIETELLQMASELIDTSRPDFTRSHFFQVYSQSVRPYVRNQRDVTRLRNEFRFQMQLHGAYVNSVDLLALSALVAFDPRLYDWTASHRDKLLGSADPLRSLGDEGRGEKVSLISGSFHTSNPSKVLEPLFPGALGGTAPTRDERVREKRICEVSNFDRFFTGEVEPAEYITWELPQALTNDDVGKATQLIADALDDGQTETVLTTLTAWAPYLTRATATTLAEVLLEDSDSFDVRMPDELLALSEVRRASGLLGALFKAAGSEAARRLLIDAIGKASLEQLEPLAHLVNDQMLAYGQRKTDADVTAQWMSKEGLECAKDALVRRARAFDPLAWKCQTPMVIALWGEFDAEGFGASWRAAAEKDPLGLCRLICACAGEWKGGGGGWSVPQCYIDPAFSRAEAMAILEEVKCGRMLGSLSLEDRIKVISYYAVESPSGLEHLTTAEAEQLVGKWV